MRIQILTALITFLLLALYKAKHRLRGTLWMVLSILRAGPFQRPVTEQEIQQRRKRQRDRLAQVQPSLFP